MVIGPGSAHLIGWSVCCAEELRVVDEHGLLAAHRTRRRSARSRRSDRGFGPSRAARSRRREVLDERRDEVLTGLLAVADDVDAGRVAAPGRRRAARPACPRSTLLALQLPRRPEGLGFREPGGLRQAADDGGGQGRVHDRADSPRVIGRERGSRRPTARALRRAASRSAPRVYLPCLMPRADCARRGRRRSASARSPAPRGSVGRCSPAVEFAL